MARKKKSKSKSSKAKASSRPSTADASNANNSELLEEGTTAHQEQLREPLLPSPSDDANDAAEALHSDIETGKHETIPLATAIESPTALEATLVADANDFNTSYEVAPSAPQNTDVVHITAPATLPPGFTFVATLDDGRAFTVTVPSTGVLSGDVIEVPYPTQFLATTVVPPDGYWKDGLLGCCSLGCCHPTLWVSWLCPLIGIGQINTRLRLNWLGCTPRNATSVRSTFAILILITVLHFTIINVVNWLGHTVDPIYYQVGSIVSLLMMLFQIYSIAQSRRAVRKRYNIPTRGCLGLGCGCCRCCEDVCVAALCSCCATGQMLRHTADYETYRGAWCTGTGLPRTAPVVV